jgi:hypothetical protein
MEDSFVKEEKMAFKDVCLKESKHIRFFLPFTVIIKQIKYKTKLNYQVPKLNSGKKKASNFALEFHSQ